MPDDDIHVPTLGDLSAMSAPQLRATIEDLLARIQDLHVGPDGELRKFADREQAAFDQLLNMHARARAHLAIRETVDRGGRGAVERAFGGSLAGSTTPFVDDAQSVLRMAGGEARDRALRALETRGQNLKPDQQDQVETLLRAQISKETPNVDGAYIAKRSLITESDAYRSAWRQVVTDPHPVLTAEEAAALRALRQLDVEYRAMFEGSSAAGGYGVPVFIDPTIVMTAQESLNPVRRISRTEVITTNAWKGVSSAGVSWSWDAENAEVSDDSPTLAQPTVTAFTARGFIPFSIEVGMDYPSFADECAKLLAEGYDELLAAAFATGSGSGQPRGIVTALDANTNVEVLLTTAGTFGAVDMNKAWKALPDRFKGRGTWVMSHDVATDVASFANAQNLASFYTTDLTGVLTTLRTRPVEFSSYFPGSISGTSHQNQLVVGDFSNYLIASRAGMSIELIPHLIGLTNNRPTAQRGWFAWARAGADSINDLGFRILNQT
jgi:HK97 family phage major capsid protein